MSSIKEMKGSVDVKLDKLDARADAFQAALAGSKAQIDWRIQHHRQVVRQALDKLATDIEQQKDLRIERKESMRSLVDNLNKQIASSQAAAHQTLATSRQQIHEVTQKIKTEVETILSAQSKSTNAELLHESIGNYGAPSCAQARRCSRSGRRARFASVEDKVRCCFR